MQTSVNLQEPFSYSEYPMIIIVGILIILAIYWIDKKIRKKAKKDIIQVKQVSQEDTRKIKDKYLKILEELNQKIENNQISLRGAYQEISSIIRMFVYEETNIQVQNYTLRDIEKINMPVLYELVREYYTPEFARNSKGDIKASLNKTKEVIEKWN